eukprot:TRINITY_DN44952_c0_g1_i1.p1 TRINITY_DN44952_c0_g1~~TRINITY_DN44952_c0_g1_i1.p1  ORF type:complete len:114 (+),score=7.05 TRINITY_DN44952_c0_g1_i1:28-369(+)
MRKHLNYGHLKLSLTIHVALITVTQKCLEEAGMMHALPTEIHRPRHLLCSRWLTSAPLMEEEDGSHTTYKTNSGSAGRWKLPSSSKSSRYATAVLEYLVSHQAFGSSCHISLQ